jgi:hypothetical protein
MEGQDRYANILRRLSRLLPDTVGTDWYLTHTGYLRDSDPAERRQVFASLLRGFPAEVARGWSAHRGVTRQRSKRDRELVLMYVKALEERHRDAVVVRSWDRLVTLQPNGDTSEKITATLLADRGPLHFFTIRPESCGDRPKRLRRKVQVNARTTPTHGVQHSSRTDVTILWVDDNQMMTTVHFAEPVAQGDEVTLVATINWPGRA